MAKQIPHVHDPARTATPQAAKRAERRARYESMTAEEIIRYMPDRELSRNARRGAIMAIAEQERRVNAAAMAMHTHADMIIPDPDLDIGV